MRTVLHVVLALCLFATAMTGRAPLIQYSVATSPLNSGVKSILPAEGAQVGVAHPVVVTFNGPINPANRAGAERSVAVTSMPAMTGHYEWLASNVVQWVPDHYWPAHSTIALSVGGRFAEFKTGPAVVGVADISDHTFTVTIDGVQYRLELQWVSKDPTSSVVQGNNLLVYEGANAAVELRARFTSNF